VTAACETVASKAFWMCLSRDCLEKACPHFETVSRRLGVLEMAPSRWWWTLHLCRIIVAPHLHHVNVVCDKGLWQFHSAQKGPFAFVVCPFTFVRFVE
jgi:hypothetical protein